MSVLHFPDAVDEHHRWLEKLIAALRGERNDLHEHEIVRDDLCVIGHWLHGDGLIFAHLPEFLKVRKYHKEIHDIAAQAWTAKQNGAVDEIEDFLSQLREARHDLFMSWNELNRHIGALD